MPDDAANDTDVYDATLDPATDSPDLTDAQATLQQDEQAEAAAAATGDYSTANDDAQQAYQASQDVADAGGPDDTDATWQAAQNESWANADQETANEDAATAASYANDPSGNPDTDAADAQMYAADAETEGATADDSAAAGEYGGDLGPDETAVADEAPVEDTAAVDDTATVDDDSSAGD
jgi:hypothetical protein